MKKSIIIIFLTAFLLLCAGCLQELRQNADVGPSTGSVEKTIITWYYFPVFAETGPYLLDGSYERYVAAKFEESHPDIDVRLVPVDFANGPAKLKLAIEQESCNVIFDAPGRIIEYGKKGKLLPLNSCFDEAFLQDLHNDTLLKACSAGSQYYMYPLSSSPFYMAFNRNMLRQAGNEAAVHEGWTTSEFTAVLRELRKAGFVGGSLFYNGTGGDQGTRAFICNLYNSPLIADDLSAYTLDTDQAIKGLSLARSLVAQGLMTDGAFFTGTDDINNFVNGKTAFTILWSGAQLNAKAGLLAQNGIEIVEVPFPSDTGTPQLEYLLNGFAVVKNKDTRKEEASLQFIKFLCDDPVMGRLNVIQSGGIPVRKSFADVNGTDEMKKLARWSQYYAVYYNTVDGFSEMRNYWIDTLQSLIKGTKSPSMAAHDFVMLSNKALQTSP